MDLEARIKALEETNAKLKEAVLKPVCSWCAVNMPVDRDIDIDDGC